MSNHQERLHPSMAMHPDASGRFMRWPEGGFAAGPWSVTADRTYPPPPLNVWLITQAVDANSIPEVLKFTGTAWVIPNGARKAIPWRWAEIVLVEPVTETQPVPVAPLDSPALGQDLVNALFKNFKRADILNWFDRSPYNNPNEGVPEE